MSFTAKATFTLCCTASFGIIFYVHYKQEAERKQLHMGVERDIERQNKRRLENLQMLEEQQLLTKQLSEAQQKENQQAA